VIVGGFFATVDVEGISIGGSCGFQRGGAGCPP
jgi:hypothetical protein